MPRCSWCDSVDMMLRGLGDGEEGKGISRQEPFLLFSGGTESGGPGVSTYAALIRGQERVISTGFTSEREKYIYDRLFLSRETSSRSLNPEKIGLTRVTANHSPYGFSHRLCSPLAKELNNEKGTSENTSRAKTSPEYIHPKIPATVIPIPKRKKPEPKLTLIPNPPTVFLSKERKKTEKDRR